MVRAFVETEIKPFVDDWIDSGTEYPMALHAKVCFLLIVKM